MQIFEALQIFKSAYQKSHISAGVEAARHIDAMIQCLEEQEETETDNI